MALSVAIWEALENIGYSKFYILGNGQFGKVYQANRTNGDVVSIKLQNVKIMERDDCDNLQTEVHLLREFHHPNVIEYLGVHMLGNIVVIVMEKCECSLHDVADFIHRTEPTRRSSGVFDETQLATATRDILAGLAYLHGHRVVHRDVKLRNLLVSKDGRVCIADLGSGIQMLPGENVVHGVAGTPPYMAPELVLQFGYTEKVDIWSMGMSLLHMLFGKAPLALNSNTIIEIIREVLVPRKIQIGTFLPRENFRRYSTHLDDCIAKMLAVKPDHRLSAQQLLRLPFIKKFAKKQLTFSFDISTINETRKAGKSERCDDKDVSYPGKWNFDINQIKWREVNNNINDEFISQRLYDIEVRLQTMIEKECGVVTQLSKRIKGRMNSYTFSRICIQTEATTGNDVILIMSGIERLMQTAGARTIVVELYSHGVQGRPRSLKELNGFLEIQRLDLPPPPTPSKRQAVNSTQARTGYLLPEGTFFDNFIETLPHLGRTIRTLGHTVLAS